MATALSALMSLPGLTLVRHATPVEPMTRLASRLGAGCPKLLIKRDDLLSFAMGGNKVRKMQLVAAEAMAAGADALITCGAVQSNHARVTAATGAALGLRVGLVLNGPTPSELTGNARLDGLFGAAIRYVGSRKERTPAMEAMAAEWRAQGGRPFIVPLGASTASGALGIARAIGEISAAGVKPDVIVHATSSGGTQAGLIAGCSLFGVPSRLLGISADDPAERLQKIVSKLLREIGDRLGAASATVGGDQPIEVDDRFVGAGYGVPTPESTEALELVARTEGIVLDPVYTSKAMAGLLSLIRERRFTPDDTILFWHTGGAPGFFA
jgi:D-cysteine desulfhydrase